MASYRKRYEVFGHPRSEGSTRRGKVKSGMALGYVKDYNSVYALERARRDYPEYVIHRVLLARY
jgi:hypothetical protein